MNYKRLFDEIDKHLMEYEKPSAYINDLLKEGKLDEYPFSMLSDLKKVDQNIKYHPEGSVWNHTMLVLDEAASRRGKSENPRVFMWTALLHDIGKGPTTRVRKGRIVSYEHERVGAKMAAEFLKAFDMDESFIKGVTSLVRWHMEPLFAAKELPFSNIRGMLQDVSLEEISLLSLCDRFGRGDMSKEKMEDEEKGIRTFIEKSKRIMKS